MNTKRRLITEFTLVLTYHPALTKVYEILQKAHRHALESLQLAVVLPSSPQLASHNAKTLKYHLVRSKLKTTYEKPGFTICRKNCETCHILHEGNALESLNTAKNIRSTFHLTVIAEMLFTC